MADVGAALIAGQHHGTVDDILHLSISFGDDDTPNEFLNTARAAVHPVLAILKRR